MAEQRLDRTLEASVDVAAEPADVWRIVGDIRRTGEWSPECSRALPLGQVRKGGWILGFNHHRRVRWVTLSRIVRFDPEREIAWKVLTNRSVWSYHLRTIDDGTRLTETRETPRGVGGFARVFTKVLLGGQVAHDDELEAGMTAGLERIKTMIQTPRAFGSSTFPDADNGATTQRGR